MISKLLNGVIMKRISKSILMMILFITAATLYSSNTFVVAQDEHDAHGGNECDTPTQQVMINTHSTDIAFDKTEIKVEKGTCVMFMFKNTQDGEHDFTILRTNGSEWSHLHLDNSLDNTTGPAPGTRMVHLMMPDEDVALSDLIQQLASPGEDLLEYLNVDSRGLFPYTSHNPRSYNGAWMSTSPFPPWIKKSS